MDQSYERSQDAALGTPGRLIRRLFSGQFPRFCVVGMSGYVVNLAAYVTLLRLSVDFRLAAGVSFCGAVVSNYLLNRAWTFRDRRAGFAAQGIRFSVVSFISLGVNEISLTILARIGMGKVLAEATACIVAIPVSFLGNKYWAFGRPSKPVASPGFRPLASQTSDA